MDLSAGTRLGPYEIIGPLGAGAVLTHGVGPLGDDAAGRHAVVPVAARLPDVDTGEIVLERVVLLVHDVLADVHPGQVFVFEPSELAHHVVDLALDHVDDRSVVGVE